MADIYGAHFEFGGVSSRKYSLIIANVNTNRVTTLAGQKEGISIFNKTSKKRYLIGDDYSNYPISLDIEIITEDDACIGVSDRRQIEKWLFNYTGYRRLYIDIDDDELGETYEYIDGKCLRNYLNCRLLNPERIEYQGGVVGYKATLEADSGMYWQDATIKTFEINHSSISSTSNITVYVDTDSGEYIYPKVTIIMGGQGGDITISNNSDDNTRFTKFVNVGAYANIVMNGELNYINGQYYEKFYKMNFIRLLDGENKLTISGNVSSVTIEYAARRMM